jgi:perosamine synthetase
VSELAINGGAPVRTNPFPAHNFIGQEEKDRVMQVLDSGILSQYLGAPHPDFDGGPLVNELEDAWAEAFDAEHAVAVNSATSGIVAALGALGLSPGDEVITSPYTMSASATAAFAYHAVPVFADIQDDIFNIDPKSIEERITPRTKAIVAVHLFGHSADMDPIMELARKHDIKVVEDAAQAPGATYKGRPVGTLGDIGVFSLNFHKHIHAGEGGLVTTNDDELALRVQLIRNHGENVVGHTPIENISNTFGFNWRLPEMSAAVAVEQLKRLPDLLERRIHTAEYLAARLAGIPAISPPTVYDDCRHVYYAQPFKFDEAVAGVTRARYIDAVLAELPSSPERENVPLMGYPSKPLYLSNPMYQQKIAIGQNGAPFRGPGYESDVDYSEGICPVTERLFNGELFTNEYFRPPTTEADMDDVFNAFEKVWDRRDELSPEGT